MVYMVQKLKAEPICVFVDIVITNDGNWEEKELSAEFPHTLVVVIIVFLSTRELEVSYVLTRHISTEFCLRPIVKS